MMRIFLWFAFLFFPTLLLGTDLRPWYPRYAELQPYILYRLQQFNRVSAKGHDFKRASLDHFLHFSLSGSIEPISVEIETAFANTRHQTFNFSDVRFTGRYQWLSDTVGDSASLVTGMTFTQSNKISRHDLSQFYHGGIQAEAHAALGKEWSCEQFWTSRIWGVLGLGFADLGSPWLRGDISWEINDWDRHSLGLFIHTLWGLGTHNLHHHKHFHGYGPIRHRSIDVGIEYNHTFEWGGIISLGYARRVFAHNFPQQANLGFFRFNYPFGL
jgi:hypothetical protein